MIMDGGGYDSTPPVDLSNSTPEQIAAHIENNFRGYYMKAEDNLEIFLNRTLPTKTAQLGYANVIKDTYAELDLNHKFLFYQHGLSSLQRYLENIFYSKYLLASWFTAPTVAHLRLFDIGTSKAKHKLISDGGFYYESGIYYLHTLRGQTLNRILDTWIRPLLNDIRNLQELTAKNIIKNPASVFVRMLNFRVVENPYLIRYMYILFEHYLLPPLISDLHASKEDLIELTNIPLVIDYKSILPEGDKNKKTLLDKAIQSFEKKTSDFTLNELILKASQENRALNQEELKEFLKSEKIESYLNFLYKLYDKEKRLDLITLHFQRFSVMASSSPEFQSILEFQARFKSRSKLTQFLRTFDHKRYLKNEILLSHIRNIYSYYFITAAHENLENVLFFANNFVAKDITDYGFSRFEAAVTIFSIDIFLKNLLSISSSIKTSEDLNKIMNSNLFNLFRSNASQTLLIKFSSEEKVKAARDAIIKFLARKRVQLTTECVRYFN